MDAAKMLYEAIKETAAGLLDAQDTQDVVILTLESVDPPVLRKNSEVTFEGANVIMPRGVYFAPSDVGKRYVCLQANSGQNCYVLYERGS